MRVHSLQPEFPWLSPPAAFWKGGGGLVLWRMCVRLGLMKNRFLTIVVELVVNPPPFSLWCFPVGLQKERHRFRQQTLVQSFEQVYLGQLGISSLIWWLEAIDDGSHFPEWQWAWNLKPVLETKRSTCAPGLNVCPAPSHTWQLVGKGLIFTSLFVPHPAAQG